MNNMNFDTMFKREAIAFSEDPDILNCILISITQPGDPDVSFFQNEHIRGILSVHFLDSEEELPLSIQPSEARRIVTFVGEWKDRVEEIVVHCEEGLSRSAGICAALMKWLNGSDTEVFSNPAYRPNHRCYRLVLEEIERVLCRVGDRPVIEKIMRKNSGEVIPAFDKHHIHL